MLSDIQLAVILPAAGVGARLPGHIKKQYRKLDGKEIFIYTLENVLNIKFLKEVILVTAKEDIPEIKNIINQYFPSQLNLINFVEGGDTRQKSVLNGLLAVSSYINYVAIHDIVRPFASTTLFDKTLEEAIISGGAIPVLPIKDTIKMVDKNKITKTIDRAKTFLAQTPQVFEKNLILNAHQIAEKNKIECTDDSQIAEIGGLAVTTVTGEETNIKITTTADFLLAEFFISSGMIKD